MSLRIYKQSIFSFCHYRHRNQPVSVHCWTYSNLKMLCKQLVNYQKRDIYKAKQKLLPNGNPFINTRYPWPHCARPLPYNATTT